MHRATGVQQTVFRETCLLQATSNNSPGVCAILSIVPDGGSVRKILRGQPCRMQGGVATLSHTGSSRVFKSLLYWNIHLTSAASPYSRGVYVKPLSYCHTHGGEPRSSYIYIKRLSCEIEILLELSIIYTTFGKLCRMVRVIQSRYRAVKDTGI